MKCLLCLLTICVLTGLSVDAQKKIFLRFYDPSGHKFEKGQFVTSTDSSIVISRDTALIEIPISSIYSIKTKRSFGHHALVSSLVSGIPLTVYAVSTGEPHTNENTFSGMLHDATTFRPGEAAILGIFGGMVIGTITGAIISGQSKTFIIDGDIKKWKKFRIIIIQ